MVNECLLGKELNLAQPSQEQSLLCGIDLCCAMDVVLGVKHCLIMFTANSKDTDMIGMHSKWKMVCMHHSKETHISLRRDVGSMSRGSLSVMMLATLCIINGFSSLWGISWAAWTTLADGCNSCEMLLEWLTRAGVNISIMCNTGLQHLYWHLRIEPKWCHSEDDQITLLRKGIGSFKVAIIDPIIGSIIFTIKLFLEPIFN